MSEDLVILSFPGVSTGEGNLYASSLSDALKDVDPGVTVERRKERPETQDFGATLAIIVGSAAASAVAKGLATWLAKHSGARLTMSTEAGTVLATNLDSRDAARIAEALSRRK
jgi:hypothetical protein